MIELCPFRPQDTERNECTETQRYGERDLNPQVSRVRKLILPSRYGLVFHVAVGLPGRSCNSRELVRYLTSSRHMLIDATAIVCDQRPSRVRVVLPSPLTSMMRQVILDVKCN